MDNSEIVDIVYKTFKLKTLIKKLINDGTSLDDLEQYIYVYLLTMDNSLLNGLYKRKELRKWICQIIMNQRNYYRSVYNLDYKIQSSDYIEHKEDIDECEHDYRIDFIAWELERIPFGATGLTNSELRKVIGYEIFKHYVKTGNSMEVVAKQFNMCRTTARTLINEAKKNIKTSFDLNYYIYIEKIINRL